MLGDLVLLRQPGDGMFVDPVGIVYVLCPIDGLFSYNGLFTYVCYLCINSPIIIICMSITIGLWYYY